MPQSSQLLNRKENLIAIRFRLPADALERIAFAYSPLLEAMLSLHVLAEPKHHSLQHPWVRRMRSLPPALKRELAALAFVYRRFVPDFLTPTWTEGYPSFGDELARMRGLDATLLSFELTRPFYDHAGDRDPAKLDRPEVREHIVGAAESYGADPKLAALALDDPRTLAERLAALLEAYWEAAFEEEWKRLEPRLADTVGESGRQLADEGVYAFLGGLWPQLRVDAAGERFGIDVPHDHEVPIGAGDQLVLVPSAYAWPHVHVNCDAPWPLAIVYPAPFTVRDARPKIPSAELTRVLKAVADDTRLRALRLIAERPRSTQELAPLVGISEAGLSKHLRLLAEAGLVETRREGYYVLYSLVPDRIAPISAALLSFLRTAA